MIHQEDGPRFVTLAFASLPADARYESVSRTHYGYKCMQTPYPLSLLLFVHPSEGFTQETRQLKIHHAQRKWLQIPLDDLFCLHHQRSRASPSSKPVLWWFRPSWHTRRWSYEWMSLWNLDLQQPSIYLLLPRLHILWALPTWSLLLSYL